MIPMFLSIQYEHPLSKGKKNWRKICWNKKKASQVMPSLEHSYRNDTESDEELPSFGFVQSVQDQCKGVSEQTISEEPVDTTTNSS